MTPRAPSRPPRSSFVLLAGLVLASLAGCNFDPLSAPVPVYTCTNARSCPNGTCIEGVCAASTADATNYFLLRTVVPATSNRSGVRTFTHPPFALSASETHDLVFPPSHAVYGVVRYEGGDVKVGAQITLTRVLAVAGRFVDEVRTVAPGPAASDDGYPADYRVDVAASDAHLAIVMPTPALTPALAGVPGNLVGQPLSEVFPPMVVLVDPANVTASSSRIDFQYPMSLFSGCAGTSAVACTATGRVVSVDGAGATVPEAGLRVYLESVDSEQPISTTATTDANGFFAIRVSDTVSSSRLRIAGSDARPSFPSVALADGAFDPHVGGDVVVPSVNVVHFVGRVEYNGEPSAYAVVHVVARELTAATGAKIFGAEYESTVRTTTAVSTDGAGLFALDLVEGQYDFIASDSSSESAVARMTVVIAKPPGGGDQVGQTILLGAALHVGGAVSGPDERPLPYSSVEARSYVPWNATSALEAYARPASTTADAASHFDLMVDSGYFDVVVSNDLAEGLPVAVIPQQSFTRGGSTGWLMVRIPRAVVLTGTVRAPDGAAIPEARVEAYYVAPGVTSITPERPIGVGQVVADGDGAYHLLLPSAIGN